MRIYTINTNNYVENFNPPNWVEVVEPKKDFGDPVRNSRKDKILCPFVDEDSVYVDASKVHLLNNKFLYLSKKILSGDKFFVMQHPHKHSYLNECMEYYKKGWVDYDTIIKFTKHLYNLKYDFKDFFSPLCTILWRKKGLVNFNNLWWQLYMSGGVRDQAAFSASLQLSKINYQYEYSIDFLNQFTNAGYGGEWWSTRQGDYQYFTPEDPEGLLNELMSITGLTKFRYKNCCKL